MKPAALALLVASLATATAATAAAQNDTLRVRTAGDLADLCGASRTDPTGPERINFCHGYTQGALEMEMKRERAVKKPLICITSPAPTRAATVDEFVKWVRAIPAHATQPATDGFFQFMSERFPCPKTDPSK